MVLPSKAKHINLVSSTPPFCGYFAVKLPNSHPVLHPPLAVTCDLVSSIPPALLPFPVTFSHSLQPFSVRSFESQMTQGWEGLGLERNKPTLSVQEGTAMVWWPRCYSGDLKSHPQKLCPFPCSAVTPWFVGHSICYPHCPSWVPMLESKANLPWCQEPWLPHQHSLLTSGLTIAFHLKQQQWLLSYRVTYLKIYPTSLHPGSSTNRQDNLATDLCLTSSSCWRD